MKAVRYAIPNLFTGLSFCLGLWSVGASHTGELELAGWLIVWCALLDIADGAAARILNASSRFGAEFDSFADLVAFGIAPAMLAYAVAGRSPGIPSGSAASWLVAAGCIFFALMSALRLARFNATPPELHAGWFHGIPTTLAGSIVATSVLIALPDVAALGAAPGQIIAAELVVLALAMISTLRFPKIAVRQSRAVNVFQLALLITVYACGILRFAPGYLFVVAVSFAALGLLIGFLAARPGR